MPEKTRAFVIWVLVAILVISLPYAYYLNFSEFGRLLVFGLLILTLFNVYKGEYSKAFWRRAITGLGFAYLAYACDPVTSITFYPDGEVPVVMYFYSLITLAAAGVLLLTIFVAGIQTRHANKNFLSTIGFKEWLIYILLFLALLILAGVECNLMLRKGLPRPYVGCVVVKPLTILIFFFAATRMTVGIPGYEASQEENEENPETNARRSLLTSYNLFLGAFLVYLGYSLVFGFVRVGAAVSNMRLTNKIYYKVLKDGTKGYPELLKAYSLCDDEAAKIYSLGYDAGERRWLSVAEHSDESRKHVRKLEQEALLSAFYAQTQDFRASYILDGLARDYVFVTTTVTQQLPRLARDAQKDVGLLYFVARIYDMIGNQQGARRLNKRFLQAFPENPNGNFFNDSFDPARKYNWECRYWLAEQRDAMVERTVESIVLLNGRSVAGWLWLPKGRYKFTLWARDEGIDHARAKELNFDPTCKADVWIDNMPTHFDILSEDRNYHSYEFTADVNETPARFSLEFLNDRDEGNGADRNLSLRNLEIECVK